MRTVKELKQELDKFPEDALCFAYDGEASGISIKEGRKYGFIYVSEVKLKDEETELLGESGYGTSN